MRGPGGSTPQRPEVTRAWGTGRGELWANGDGELVWGDEIVLEVTVVMLRGHVNVLNGPELERLQTVKTEDFILCVFYHNFY